MWVLLCALLLLSGGSLGAQETLGERARRYLIDLTKLDTTNPPGNETRVARYLEEVARQEGIACEVLGGDPERLNFVGRLTGSGKKRPLLLMAHSDVVPADPSQWSVPPFEGVVRDGVIWGRGTLDTKSLLAAGLAVVVEARRQGMQFDRDLILLAEADEEAGSTGIQWLIANAWNSIDAEFALNEGGSIVDVRSGRRIYQIQTTEKIPTRAVLRVRGTAGHASLPLADNPVVALSRALVRVADADQPVRMNDTTRRYFGEIVKLPDYRWLAPLVGKLRNVRTAGSAANEIRMRDPELDAQLRTSISPTMLQAGLKINVIPNVAEAQLDIRRLPTETSAEVFARLRKIVNDPGVEVTPAPGQQMPPTDPSPLDNDLYKAMEQVFSKASQDAVVLPYMQRGATDGAYLRQKGMPVYGVPLFTREGEQNLAHGNDERISETNLENGTRLLWDIVAAVAGK